MNRMFSRHAATQREKMRPVHFISGLPRSGSTLLAALLRQNPRFHAHMSSPIAGMVDVMMGEMSDRNEFAAFITDAQRQRVLHGLFASYYGAEFPADVIFDTSRRWCSKLPVLGALFPDFKVIACVRNVSWIIDSLERAIQRNALRPSFMNNFQTGGTIYNRVEGIAFGEGLVGYSYNALKEAFYGDHAHHLMLLQYETLVGNPAMAMAAVYDFIDEVPFQHDFDNVHFDADEFDERTGMPGLHAVGKKVVAPERKTVLPPDIFRRFENDAFWRNASSNIRAVRVV
ncbi:sulfotransferase family protein [Variovorax guangxiensis]|uniref:Sulfotransferase n=1 Tax=Variovorax guangxiensis TaxID=1775474 RepID=A0A840FTB5_9BURK|nr:sulfotransferase [Variovorax guangxiensis]MBB4225856.1 sulfotransferase [Variovorax guangxiensis]